MVKTVEKEQQQEIKEQLQVLTEKIEAMDAKLNKVEQFSNTALSHTETLLSGNDINRVNLIVSNNVSDPNGFIAREITNQLIVMLQKYQTTEFRRWLVVRGRNIVEQSVSNFVSQLLPNLKWYGVNISKIDDKNYHQSAKTTFPLQIKTGIPVISTVTVAKVDFEFESDVDIANGKLSNTKSSIKTGEEEKKVFKSLVDDLNSSLKPHKTAYAILRPIGIGLGRVYALLLRETNFSIPLLVLLLFTMIYPAMFPAAWLYFGVLRLYPIWAWFFGISIQNLILGIINGVIYGGVIWLAIKYKFLERVKVLSFLTKINKPGGPQIDLRIAVGVGLAAIVLIAGVWWIALPRIGVTNETAIRLYSDPDSSAMLKALQTSNYYSINNILDGATRSILTEPGFAGYSLYVKRDLGNFNSTVFWKATDNSGIVKAYYNATYSGHQGSIPVVFTFTTNGGIHYLANVEFQAPSYKFKIP